MTNETEAAEVDSVEESVNPTTVWREAVAARRTELTDPETVTATQAAPM